MFIGARCAYVVLDKARLGVIIKLGEDHHLMKLDSGNVVPVNPDRLRLVNYWQDRLRERDADTLRTFQNNTDALEIFRSKKAVIFGPAAMRAMWYWGNHNVFHNALKEPKLLVSTNKKTYGRYRRERGKKFGSITASARNHNLYELFTTMLHEQTHQYNFEIDQPKGDFDPQNEGVHGQIFLKWIPIIQQKAGVKITVKADPGGDVTEFDEGVGDEPTTQPFIFVLLNMRYGWVGLTVKDKTDLTMLTGELSSILNSMQPRAKDENIYAGISTLKRVKDEFKIVRNGTVNLNSIKSLPATSVVKLAAQHAKEIDGWRLPPMSKFE